MNFPCHICTWVFLSILKLIFYLGGLRFFSQRSSSTLAYFMKMPKKNEKNVYCLNCCISLCPHCLSPHRSHRLLQVSLSKFTAIIFQSSLLSPFSFLKLLIVRFLNCVLNFLIFVLLQIRRYVYHDVLRLDDAAKLIDCTFVQVSSSS